MADKKISQLNAAATPLAGAEILPIVQSGATVKVSVADLTAGRTVTASDISAGLGAVGTPSYTFTGDTNTGMWSPAADTVAFSTAGSERMRITSAGNVGIGTSSPGSLLTLSSAAPRIDFVETDVASANTTRLVQEGSVFRIQTVNSGVFIAEDYAIPRDADGAIAHRWLIQNTERMRINSAGNVGIGTSSPNAAARLDVTSTTSGFLPPRMTTTQRDAIGSPPNGLMLYNTTTDKLQVRAGGAWVDLH
jgi:hypothetical protein